MTGHLKGTERELVREWWQALQPADKSPSQDGGKPNHNFFFDRGHRARLRRCTTLADVAQEPAPWVLAKKLKLHESDNQALLLVAGALAYVTDDAKDGMTLAYLLGVSSAPNGESGKLSEMRFQRLMRLDEPDDFLKQLRRAIDVGGRRADVTVLANDLFAWTAERQYTKSRSDGMKYRWARDFYLKRPDQSLLRDTPDVPKS